MLKGITVTLHVKTKTGEDAFGADVYIGQPTEADIVNANQFGKHVQYTLGIPKEDTHVWEDTEVEFWGKKFRTVGMPVQGIDEMVPLSWGRNVMVECYE